MYFETEAAVPSNLDLAQYPGYLVVRNTGNARLRAFPFKSVIFYCDEINFTIDIIQGSYAFQVVFLDAVTTQEYFDAIMLAASGTVTEPLPPAVI